MIDIIDAPASAEFAMMCNFRSVAWAEHIRDAALLTERDKLNSFPDADRSKFQTYIADRDVEVRKLLHPEGRSPDCEGFRARGNLEMLDKFDLEATGGYH